MTQLMAPPCSRCGRMLDAYGLACRNCGALAYRAELEHLSAEAVRLEPVDPMAAALRWRRCLELLPRDAAQYAAIYHRLGALTAGAGAADPSSPYAPGAAVRLAAAPPADDPPLVALVKTAGSMAVSIVAYALLIPGDPVSRLLFATGFVVLILVHELGHVAAMRYYGLSASPPIFIPFLGALIRLRQAPRDAKVEAVIGIGGPVAGTVGAVACYALYLAMPGPDDGVRSLVLILAELGVLLNLFNLLPVPPLDGGRVTAALSPRIWMLGVGGLVAMIAWRLYAGQYPILLVVVLLFALPRVRATLANRAAGANTPYYAITRTSRWAIGTVYVGLGAFLAALWYLTGDPLNLFG